MIVIQTILSQIAVGLAVLAILFNPLRLRGVLKAYYYCGLFSAIIGWFVGWGEAFAFFAISGICVTIAGIANEDIK